MRRFLNKNYPPPFGPWTVVVVNNSNNKIILMMMVIISSGGHETTYISSSLAIWADNLSYYLSGISRWDVLMLLTFRSPINSHPKYNYLISPVTGRRFFCPKENWSFTSFLNPPNRCAIPRFSEQQLPAEALWTTTQIEFASSIA